MSLPALQYCRAEIDGGLFTITINRPEVLNALNPGAHHELASLFDHYAATPSLRVAILTGEGRSFCVGSDLKAMAAQGRAPKPASGYGGLTQRRGLLKPVIAAVNGLCIGGGLEILLACDLAVASSTAQFALPEPKVGLAADNGLPRLVRQVPLKEAMRLALTGNRIDAAQALRIGLVNEVAPPEQLMARARALAEEIIVCAPLAIEATMEMIQAGLAEPDIDAALARTYPALVRMRASEDAREGPRAFSEKRKPQWQGK